MELGDKLARIVEVLTPGGTEAWFEELAGLEPGESDGFERACQRYHRVLARQPLHPDASRPLGVGVTVRSGDVVQGPSSGWRTALTSGGETSWVR